MLINEMKSSRYLKKETAGDGLLVTMDRIEQENVALDGEDAEMKYVLYFKDDVSPMVLNWTNIETIADIVGSNDTDDWADKKIVVYNDPSVRFAGKKTGGIRVRSPSAADVPTRAATPTKEDAAQTGGSSAEKDFDDDIKL